MDLRRVTAFFVSRGAQLGELVVLAALAGRQDKKNAEKITFLHFFGYTDKF